MSSVIVVYAKPSLSWRLAADFAQISASLQQLCIVCWQQPQSPVDEIRKSLSSVVPAPFLDLFSVLLVVAFLPGIVSAHAIKN